MGGSQGKYAEVKSMKFTSLTQVRYEPDIMTVRERLLNELEWSKFIRDKYGFQSFKRLMVKKEKEVILDFWKIASGYRKQYDALSAEELREVLHDSVLKTFEDPFVRQTIGAANIDKITEVLTPGSQTRFSLNLFDSALMNVNQRLDEHEFFEWKTTEAADLFFQNTFKLESILTDHHALFYFEKQLAMEYSSENIDFLDITREYELLWSKDKPQRNLKMAENILHMYITQESPTQVNIPSNQREAIEKRVLQDKEVGRGLFQIAQRETILLMSRDGWPRYRRSRVFGQFLRSRRPVSRDQKPLSMEQAYKVRKKVFHTYIGSDSIDDVLDSMIGRDCFGKYLCVFNPKDGTMDFFSDVYAFQKLQDMDKLKKRAKTIYDTYLEPGVAQKRVHLSKQHVNSLRAVINGPQVLPTIFDASIHHLRNHLKNKRLFEKFKSTGLYTKYRLMIRAGHSGSSGY